MKLATLSFDDGHALDRDVAEILRAQGVRATFYLITNRLHILDRAWYAGHEIGSHSITHPRRPFAMSTETLTQEMSESRVLLQDWSGQSVRGYAYPCGKATILTAEIARVSGYDFARTFAIDPGNAYQIPEPYLWPVSVYADRPEESRYLDDLIACSVPISAAGHGYHFDTDAKREALQSFIGRLHAAEYTFVTNAEYVTQCLQER